MAKKKASPVAVVDAGSQEVTMDRRRKERRSNARDETQDAANDSSVDEGTDEAPKTGRRKVARRRQIDPTTCERDYSNDEIEFMQAMDAYKRSSGRMFPTCSEILEVVRELGYIRPGYGVHAETVTVAVSEGQEFDTIDESDAIAESK